MKRKSYTYFKSICLASCILFACNLYSQQTINGTITHDNMTRSYILYVPASYNAQTAVPLVFNFHGYTSNASDQMNYGDFRSIADTANFIIVHPMGTQDNTGTTHFNVGWGTSTVDDVGFTEALLDSIAAQYSIDSLRVYSTGMSNGGFMSYQLACQLGHRIAAIASVTGSMSAATYGNCSPHHSTPILQIHGTSDFVVPYNGALHAEPIDDVIDYWVNYNNCDTTPSVTSLPDLNIFDNSTVTHHVYTNGDNGVNVELFKINNGGHTWAGSSVPSPGTNYDIDASAEVWKFFSRYDLNGQIGVTTTKPIDYLASVTMYPNPATNFIILKRTTSEEIPFEIYNMAGQVMQSGLLYNQEQRLDVSGLSQGIYIVKAGQQTLKLVKVGE